MTSRSFPVVRGAPPRSRWSPLLRGRRGECEALDALLHGIRAGHNHTTLDFAVVAQIGVESDHGGDVG